MVSADHWWRWNINRHAIIRAAPVAWQWPQWAARREPLGVCRKRGRVVDCTGLENRQRATVREFESHRFRQTKQYRLASDRKV
jgi:hypothetical protein